MPRFSLAEQSLNVFLIFPDLAHRWEGPGLSLTWVGWSVRVARGRGALGRAPGSVSSQARAVGPLAGANQGRIYCLRCRYRCHFPK